MDVSAEPAWRRVRVKAGEPGPVREGWLYFPPQNETLTYDADGNLTSDARWNYAWDAENRLIVMEGKLIDVSGPQRKRLEFTYDHQSRRVRNLVKNWFSASSEWRVTKDLRFGYDGWNMVAELNATPEVMSGAVQPWVWRSYARGIDLSGGEQGAWGVGGLLLVHEQTQAFGSVPASSWTYAPCYDHNGNVLAYVDCATGLVTQRFESDPFGRETGISSMLVSGTSTSQEAPPVRFSTKYLDEETRLSYYGYRYYSAELGRWLNRDPIEEKGGINMYGMVGNDAVNRWDLLGLENGINYTAIPDRWTHWWIKHDKQFRRFGCRYRRSVDGRILAPLRQYVLADKAVGWLVFQRYRGSFDRGRRSDMGKQSQ